MNPKAENTVLGWPQYFDLAGSPLSIASLLGGNPNLDARLQGILRIGSPAGGRNVLVILYFGMGDFYSAHHSVPRLHVDPGLLGPRTLDDLAPE